MKQILIFFEFYAERVILRKPAAAELNLREPSHFAFFADDFENETTPNRCIPPATRNYKDFS